MAGVTTRDGDYLVITWPTGTVERIYWPEGTVAYVQPRPITEIQIKKALTAAERAGIRQYAASDQEVADWLDLLQSAVRSGHPLSVEDDDLRAGFVRLRQLGVFDAARLQQLQAELLT